MKKIIVILVAVIAAVFTSCSNEQAGIITTSNNVVEENANVANFVALQDQISTFNDSLGINHQVTRGFFSRLWKVICADAVGGLFGNLWEDQLVLLLVQQPVPEVQLWRIPLELLPKRK